MRRLLPATVALLLVLPGGPPLRAAPSSAGRSTGAPAAVLLGAWVSQQGTPTHYESVLNFESLLGRSLAIDQHYRTWDNKFWGEEALDVAAGRIPLITWGDYGKTTAEQINSGSQDALIREKANAIEAVGGPVLLRWGAEMAAGRYGTPESYIAAWHRIRRIFGEEGAVNVQWVWCPSAAGFRTGAAQTYYPGDDSVDWIAADGFNWYPATGEWRSLGQIFDHFYDWASQRGKPLMIAETGVMEDPADPSRKAAWFDEVVAALKSMPMIRAFVYFHARSPKGYDFWVDTSPASRDAFIRLANDPYLTADSPTVTPCTITGTEGRDVLVGTSEPDVICGLGGSDKIMGKGSKDVLKGGEGNDVLNGGGGSDEIDGGRGRDRLQGKQGGDTLRGGSGADLLAGGPGDDTLVGGPGSDRCRQGPGAGPRRSCER